MKELAARVAAAGAARAPRSRDGEEIEVESGSTRATCRPTWTGAELTPTEFRLVYALALDGRVLTRDELLQRVWGRRASHRDRTVDVFVRKLREKIDARSRNTFIQTRYGVGYKLDPAPEVAAQPPA